MTGHPLSARHIQVTRMARYYTLGGRGGEVGEAWFALHGYRQAARRFARRFSVLDAPERIVVVPEALSRFYVDPSPGRHGPEHRVGASWMTREDRDNEIADYIAYLDSLADEVANTAAPASRRRVVLGFSQGAHTASRWVVLGRADAQELVLWGAGLATDLSPDALAVGLEGVHVTFVRGCARQIPGYAGRSGPGRAAGRAGGAVQRAHLPRRARDRPQAPARHRFRRHNGD